GLTLAACLYGYLACPEPLAPKHRRSFSLKRANPAGNLAALSAYPSILGAFAALFCIQLASQSYASVWSFFAIEAVGWTPFAIGLSATAYGVMMAGVQGGLTGRAVARFGERRIVRASLLLGIISYGLISQASTGAMIYGGVVLGGFSGMAFPTIQAMMSRKVPPNAQGELQGAVTSAYSLSAIIGPVLMTQLFSSYADNTGLYFPGAPFLAAAVLIAGALLIFTVYARGDPQLAGGVSRS
ncbi:MAG: MFS transporter, partial [Pseudomonadota bacterium]